MCMVYTFESESEKNPGFTAEVLLQFHSLDGNRSYIDKNSGFSKYDCSTFDIAFG